MILDMRGLSYDEVFREIRDALSQFPSCKNDFEVFIDAHEFEKCTVIRGFFELLCQCKTIVKETCGFYVLKISHEMQPAV